MCGTLQAPSTGYPASRNSKCSINITLPFVPKFLSAPAISSLGMRLVCRERRLGQLLPTPVRPVSLEGFSVNSQHKLHLCLSSPNEVVSLIYLPGQVPSNSSLACGQLKCTGLLMGEQAVRVINEGCRGELSHTPPAGAQQGGLDPRREADYQIKQLKYAAPNRAEH